MRESQIKSLEAELSTRETEIVKHLQIQQKYEDDKARLYAENRKLEAEAATAKRDLEFLEKEMAEQKADNEDIRHELKKYSQVEERAKVEKWINDA